jgi:predicted MFS family arabinose efflux permease
MPMSFRFPDHWKDWLSWVLGFWLLLSPWIMGYADDNSATRNAVIVGFMLIFTEAVTLTAFRRWEEWASFLIGAWLLASPFVLSMVMPTGIGNAILVGGIVLLFSAYDLWQNRAHDRSET